MMAMWNTLYQGEKLIFHFVALGYILIEIGTSLLQDASVLFLSLYVIRNEGITLLLIILPPTIIHAELHIWLTEKTRVGGGTSGCLPINKKWCHLTVDVFSRLYSSVFIHNPYSKWHIYIPFHLQHTYSLTQRSAWTITPSKRVGNELPSALLWFLRKCWGLDTILPSIRASTYTAT